MFRFTLLLLLAVWVVGCAPKKYHLEFKGPPQQGDFEGRGLGQLYGFHTTEAKSTSLYRNLRFPQNFEAQDTALTLLYFNGVPGVMTGMALLVADYKSAQFRVYPDRNNNLDFSDDGPPAMANPLDSSLRLYLSRADDSTAVVGVQFKKFRDNKRTADLEKDFKRHYFLPEEMPLLPARHWLWETRLSTYQTHLKLQGDSVKIGISDFDFDGLFKKGFVSRFNLVKHPRYLGFESRDGAIPLKDSALFHYGDQVYCITDWDSLGGYIEFVESNADYDKGLKVGDPIPDVMVKTLEQRDTALTELVSDKPFTLFYLWGSWCKGCHYGAEKLREAAQKHRERLQVIGLNSGEPQFGLNAFLEKYGHDWPQYYVSSEFKEKFNVEGFPDYILVNSKGKLVSFRAWPASWPELLAE